MKEASLVTGNVFSTLLKFATPFLLANLLQALYGAVDLLVVGRFADTAMVSAVSTGSHVLQTVTNIIIGLTTGSTVLIGNLVGAKREKDVADTIGTTICVFTIVGVVLSAVMMAFAGDIAVLMNAPKEALVYTKEYVFVCACGVVFVVGYNVLSGILRGLGDSKMPLVFIAIACGINIGLDLLFVAGFHMGAKGAALATIIAQAGSVLMAIFILLKRKFPFAFGKKNIRFHGNWLKKIFFYGAPIALTNGLTDLSFLIITIIVNEMGLTASAALGITEKLIGFAMLPPLAFSSAVSAMVAQNIGAGRQDRAKKVLIYSIVCSAIFGVIVCVVCQFIPEAFTAIFSDQADVIRAAALYLMSFSIDCVLVAFVFNFNGYFIGCQKSVFTMIHGIASTFLFRIPLTYLISRMEHVTMYEMGFAAPAASIFSICCCVIYVIRLNKKNICQLT